MQALEFLDIAYNNAFLFIIINVFVFVVLHVMVSSSLYLFYVNPIYLILCVGFSTKYTIVIFLFVLGFLSLSTLVSVGFMLLAFILGMRVSSLKPVYFISKFLAFPVRLVPNSSVVPLVVSFLLLVTSILVINSSGFGLFAELNRFESARGSGVYTRVLDLMVPVALVFVSAQIARGHLYEKASLKINAWISCLLFLVFSHYLVNGAKITVLYDIMICIFTYSFLVKKSISAVVLISSAIVGFAFILVAMIINYSNNGVDPFASSQYFSGLPIITDFFINRLISNGNTAYLLLANDVYEHVDKDNIFIRFLTPLIGITHLSSILGYDVSSLSVGKQAILYYTPDYDVAGGPTSHFDIFLMVYAPFFGYIISFAFGLFLGGFNNYIKKISSLSFEYKASRVIAIALLFRVSVMIVEPPIGFAYYVDAILLLFFVSTAAVTLKVALNRR